MTPPHPHESSTEPLLFQSLHFLQFSRARGPLIALKFLVIQTDLKIHMQPRRATRLKRNECQAI